MTSTAQYRHIMMIGIGEPPTRLFTLHGLNDEELKAVSDELGSCCISNEELVDVWDSPTQALNGLGKLGYQVVTTTYVANSKKLIWMLVKTI